jgi:hypothetical protein
VILFVAASKNCGRAFAMRLPSKMVAFRKSKQKRVERGKLRQAHVPLITQLPDVPAATGAHHTALRR